jgi:hypothetical protein
MAKRKKPQPEARRGAVPSGAPAIPTRPAWQWPAAAGLLAVLALFMFGRTLWTGGDTVLSDRHGDIAQEYLHWRAFGFGELRKGNLALWNPCVFSGTPFFSGFQAALLYPPNGLFLVLPLAKAINWCIALHVFLSGLFTCWWMARRGLSPAAGFVAAVVCMFCGANFLHIPAGYLPLVCSIAWPPLIFLAIDELLESPRLGWCLLGALAVAMQALAGNPQTFVYTGMAAGIYCAFRLATGGAGGFKAAGWLAAMAAGGMLLSAVQWLAGLQEWNEMLRGGGLSYSYARTFYFPAANLLTLVAPDFFGDGTDYWGRWYLWEASLYIGVGGLLLAVLGAVQGEKRRFLAILVGLFVILSLGDQTPVFKLLYASVPGFDKFRGVSKFVLPASLFLAVLAGAGFDGLWKGHRPKGWVVGGGAVLGVALLAGALGLETDPGHRFFEALVRGVGGSHESYLPAEKYGDPAFLAGAGKTAAQSLARGGIMLLVTLALAMLVRVWRGGVGAIGGGCRGAVPVWAQPCGYIPDARRDQSGGPKLSGRPSRGLPHLELGEL